MKLKLTENRLATEIIEERINSLNSKINTCKFNYYVLNQPSLSDREYDLLVDELRRLTLEKSALINQN